MDRRLQRGAKIIIDQWLEMKEGESLLIVSSENHLGEVNALKKIAKQWKASVAIMMFPVQNGQVGHYFDEHETAFDEYDAVLGATTHSLVTTKAVKRAVARGTRFLSLPLSTNNGKSILEFDFLKMNPRESKGMADQLLPTLKKGKQIRVTTALGTDISFSMEGRTPKFFSGVASEVAGYASSSFEIFIPIREDQTEGVGMVDASLGYLGVPKTPIRIVLKGGRITQIEDSEDGKILRDYVESFQDQGMYVAGEFGIGLNRYAKCEGNCYIEDESAYGTFHIGFGRNIAFGGTHQAKGHFDLVFHKPNIYVDGKLIMREGEIVPSMENRLAI